MNSRLLTAAPPLLFGGMVSLFLLLTPAYKLAGWAGAIPPLVGLAVLVVLFFGGTVLALLRRLPAWGWTWVSMAWGLGLLAVFNSIGETHEEGGILIGPILDVVIYFGACAMGIGLMAWAAWRGLGDASRFALGLGSTYGIFSVLPWLHDVGPGFDVVPMGLSVVYAVLLASFDERRLRRALVLFAVVLLLAVGLAVLVTPSWNIDLAEFETAGTWPEMFALSATILLLPPLCAIGVRWLRGRRGGRPSSWRLPPSP